jgi:RNA polymerase sigma-70 factor (ECF subfamily)
VTPYRVSGYRRVNRHPDGHLVQRVLDGDREAFGALMARYRDRLGRYALRMLGNRADAEDALQETFIRAYRSLGSCNDPERFGPWVYGILVNRCRTLGAKRARRARVQVADDGLLARTATPGDAANDQALRDAIERALARVSPTLREAFLLRHVEELSYEEMVEVTGASIPALKMRVSRAREELRRLLGEGSDG